MAKNGHVHAAFLWIVIGAAVLLLYYRDGQKKVEAAQYGDSGNTTAGGPGYMATVPLTNFIPVSPAATIGGTGGYGGPSLLSNITGGTTQQSVNGVGQANTQTPGQIPIPYLSFMNGQSVQA